VQKLRTRQVQWSLETRTNIKRIDVHRGVVSGWHFDREVIILYVRWYLRYKLNFRDLIEMMSERGLHLAHTTIPRWCSGRRPSTSGAGIARTARWSLTEATELVLPGRIPYFCHQII